LVWACGGLLLATVLFFGLSLDCAGPPTANVILVASNNPVPITRMSVPWYFRNRQWQADMRSLAEVMHYLTDSEQITQTNQTRAKANDA
jgi:hypothetical protein